ncbi:MAG: hypothetical protein V7711_11450 [Pseudomonadales bacterium]
MRNTQISKFTLAHKLAVPLTFLVVIAALAMNAISLQQSNSSHTDKELVLALTQQLASAATEAVVAEDRLALQAMLQEISKHSVIRYAGIFDAAEAPLAEAGNTVQGRSPNAMDLPITLNDTVVGSARIVFNKPVEESLNNTTLLLMLALAVIVYPLIYLFGSSLSGQLAAITERIRSGAAIKNRYPWDDELGQLNQAAQNLPGRTTITSVGTGARSAMAIRISHLGKHMSDPVESAKLDYLFSVTDQVCRLYDGNLQLWHGGYLAIFSHGSDCGFRALCAARLLQELITKLATEDVLDYRLAIGIDREAESSDELSSPQLRELHWQQTMAQTKAMTRQSGSIALSRLTLAESDLSSRIAVSEHNDNYVLKRLNGDLEQLLQRQREQLFSVVTQPASETPETTDHALTS